MTNRDRLPEGLREAYDQVAGQRQGTVSGPYGVLLHSPQVAIRGAALGEYLRWDSDLTPAQREIAVLAAARHFDAAVMWASHLRLAREAGVREDVIEAVEHDRDLSDLTEEEVEIVRFVRELLESNRVSAQTFGAVHRRLGDRGIVDLTGLLGYYSFVAAALNAFEIEPPEGSPRLVSRRTTRY
jgi:4-carboxymuconolactone decarboxylase